MQSFDKFRLALGIFWSLMTIYFVISLLPGIWKRQHEWETRIKRSNVKIHSPSWLQRLICVLMTGMMSSELILDGLHRNFSKLTGISSGTLCLLMIIFPGLFFLAGACQHWFKKKFGAAN